ncbi:DNA-binding protein WhiA [Alicyclobacillus sp.]|uniref:DNA-binding protein WhiA n=1 Tax=Alicyclobacillus sp. TaxID=61169 RepID=UPI0025B9DB8D|nr:DNA-binding protein WhiA [Alicyclobacillus sp.]MCL6516836.1 DNA-binding protein WhiA [Alicyclobacillus sp.]
MSFAAQTKKELTLIQEAPCCRRAELQAMVLLNGELSGGVSGDTPDGGAVPGAVDGGGTGAEVRPALTIQTENVATARRIYTLLRELFDLHPEVLVRKKMRLKKNNVYAVRVSVGADTVWMGLGLAPAGRGLRLVDPGRPRACCRRAFLRGAFLAAGSVNDPGSPSYHLEISCQTAEQANGIRRRMNEYGLHAKVIARKRGHVVYVKEGEKIVEFLSVIGAHQALLRFEDVRIMKGMRNQVNRLVNCETANMNKTINAAVRQLDAIRLIDERMGLDHLPDKLREAAQLRLQYPETNLQELAQRIGHRVSKSGLNHRFRKLQEIADRLRAGE